MRPAPLLFGAVLVLALGLGWLLVPTGDDPPPPPAGSSDREAHAPTPAEPISSRVEATPKVAPMAEPTAETPTPPPPPPPTEATNLLVRVHDAASSAPAATFRWRLRLGGEVQQGEGRDGQIALLLPPGTNADLLVEADLRQPVQRTGLQAPPADQQPLAVDVTLVPVVTAAGITLHVHDLALQPIRLVRVDAFRLGAHNRDTAWHLEPALWARRATAEDGKYELPTLPPGEYGLRLVALAEDGTLAPLLPYVRTFVLTGDNGFVEDVPLEPGAVLVLEVVDAYGAPYDPIKFGTATIGLRLPGGPVVQRKWFCRTGEHETSAIDQLPGIGLAHAAQALPGGSYELEVFCNGEPRVRTRLDLPSGEVTRPRIVVP